MSDELPDSKPPRPEDDLSALKPARPDVVSDERKGYMPYLPWRWIAGVGLFLTLSVGTCHIRDRQETDALRQTVLGAYNDQLKPLADRYQDVAQKIRTNTSSAAVQTSAASYLDPRLKLDVLGGGQGLYLRVPAAKAKDPAELGNAIEPAPDAIARCLGLAPLPVAELFSKGSFLEKAWIQRADEADSVLKLRVVAEELRQRSARDLPFVAEALGAQWFMLVLERGDNRRDAPVDVYLWDLRSNKLLLSTRAKASGALVAARIAVGGVKPGHYSDGAQTSAAQDCSIASQIRAVAGDAPVTFEHTAPVPSAPELDVKGADAGH